MHLDEDMCLIPDAIDNALPVAGREFKYDQGKASKAPVKVSQNPIVCHMQHSDGTACFLQL